MENEGGAGGGEGTWGRGYLGNYVAEISEARPVQHMC